LLIGPQPTIKVIIGQDVWLGSNVVVLEEAFIADGAVVVVGALVIKSIPQTKFGLGYPQSL
jgi:acetyltransferase-like isoleucine patch superfamily enzyme